MFILGVIFAEVECQKDPEYRLFNQIRQWSWYAAIPRDLILLAIVLIYGGFEVDKKTNQPKCMNESKTDENCGFYKSVTFGFNFNQAVSVYVVGICTFLLALVSPLSKLILDSKLF